MKACLFVAFAATVIISKVAVGTGATTLRAIYTKPGELNMLIKYGHAQGATCSERAIYVSHSGGIVKLDWTGRVVKSVTARPHLGDIAYSEGRIYGVFGLRKHAKEESPIMVGVWDEDLSFIKAQHYDCPGARGIDGAVVLDGVLYTSVNSHFEAGRDHPPHCENDLMMISAENLALLGTKTVVFDYPIHYGTQTLGTDGERLLFGNYGARFGEGNTNGFNFSRSTVDMKLLDSRSYHASEGFCLVPKSVSKHDTPVFLNVNALGGNMQGWRKNPKGNPPRLRFDFFAYDVQTGAMSNITDYSSARAADVALFRHRCAAAGQKGAICVGQATSMEKIRPRDGALPKVAANLAVRLAQGEKESVQLFVTPRSGVLRNVRVAVDNLWSDNGAAFPKDAISVSVLGYVNIKNKPPYGTGVNERQKGAPGYKRKSVPCELGWWPDPILEYTNACDVADGDVQGFWLRVAAPEGQIPGVYGGKVSVFADGVGSVSVPLTIRVNAFTIPKKPKLPLAVSYRCLPIENTAAWTNGLSDAWARFAAEYKLSSCDLYCGGKSGPDFGMQEKLRALGGSECYNLGYWNPPKSTTNEADIVRWRIKVLEPMKARYATARDRGLLEGAFIYGCDEFWPKDFDRVAWAANEIQTEIPDVPLMTTARDGSFGTGSSLSMIKRFVPVNVKFDRRRAECARLEGREVWWYFACDQKAPCANSFIEGQGIEMRSIMGAQIVKYRPDGFLYYWTAAWGKNKGRIDGEPFTDWNPCSYKDYHGDGSWICRGPGDIPLPTIRIENYRDGLEDYAYAMILEAKLAARSDNDDEWSRLAKELLSVPREVVDSVRNFSDDPAVLYRWRDAMADLIEEELTQAWRPSVRWRGFNLLGMFCQTKMESGDKRIFGYFPEDRFQWMAEWGFNFARLPLDYRFFVEKDDWMKPVESQLVKLDEAVRYGKKHGIHVQINLHRAPGYCCNPPQEPKSLFLDPAPLAAFTNLWGVLAKRYRGIPNEELSFDLVNEPAPVEFYGATPSNYAVAARAAFAAIHAVDPDRFVMSDGWKWGNEPVMELHPFDSASGESIHCYEPHGLTHYRVSKPDDPRPCPPWPPAGCADGVEWLERNYVKAWRPAIDDGTFLFVGELGCCQRTGVPHATYLAWLEDVLKMCGRHGWGWALWNLDGTFGILDTSRTDCEFEDFHGHKLDRKALELLRRH